MNHQSDHFPVLGIQVFNENQSKGCQLLFNELHGERSIDDPHKHDFFIINLFEHGKGSHTIDFIKYPIENHQIHLVFPGQVHQWVIEKETIGYQLMISREWFEGFLPALRFSWSYYQNHPVINVSEEMYQLLLYEFKAIQKELNKETVFLDLIQKRSEVIGLLISKSVEGVFKDFEIYNSNPIISKFQNFIDQYFKEERSVSFYAEKLNISANYLNIVCKKSLNTSASSLIQDRILLEAKRLLKVSEMSVKDIVYDLGFYDHASFSKFFKAQTGMTPSQFKE
ncbi:AraC family transcriptional regulator [Chryseobacterium piperi]|uniref:AraC family transcriptional regulator n=1 Tax=Chryseobacterium piperi TaxID=558152 RepID=A0A086B2Q3_9FLAO|nr:helix-turn-helix domain-containing protein [Chryseobacterium piperi]ASW76280.1 AraC family transcriptional regulator [Chryseobacterium piperi]KFF23217.1 AraC family transcriptional regulator [Chryseobacterium piperi]